MTRTLTTLLLAALFLALATPALAAHSKLVITVDRPIAVFVDGTMLEFEDGTTSVELVGIDPGRHLVEFRNFVGKVVGEGSVRIPTEGPAIVRARWAGKQFSVYDTVLLAPEPRTEVVVVEHHTTVVEPVETVSVSANIGGFGMSASASAGFGTVDTVVHHDATVVHSDVVVHETVVHDDVVVHEARPTSALVTFRVTDDESMNLWIDGKRAWAYHVGSAEKAVSIPTGEHFVEVKDFMEDETVCRGQLYVDRDLTVGISVAGCLQVFNDSTAFSRR